MELPSEAKKLQILNPAEKISNNSDLLTEILLRLQVKPLFRFKCVSKQWLSLISNPQFCLSHNRHHHTPYLTPIALLLKKNNPIPEFGIVPLKPDTIPNIPLIHKLNSPQFRITQSCNGLLLCSTHSINVGPSSFMMKQSKAENIYYVCNPSTKHFKKLSIPFGNKDFLVSICMAFDPLKSNHYKVVCIRIVRNGLGFTMNSLDMIEYQIVTYSSETDSWSPLDITVTAPRCINFVVPVFCNGAVHWYSDGETSRYFDVDRECFNTMPMPNLAERTNHYKVQYFGESRGHLHLIVTQHSYPSQFVVWEMVPDYSGWFVRYHVNLDAVTIAFPELIPFRFSVLHVIQAQQDEDSIVVIDVGDKAISYNVHNGTFKRLYDLAPAIARSPYYTWRDTFQYIEILTSV